MILPHFPLHLMETCCSPHQYIVVFLLLTTISRGSTCEAPSSPQCFRRRADESVYLCEWSMNTTESDVMFDLYFNETKFGSIKKTRSMFNEEQLIRYRPVHIWVEAHAGNSSCTSTRRSVVLGQTVKYEAPQNISMSWLKNNLKLSWKAAEKHPAFAEVRFRRHEHPTESWQNRARHTANETFMYQVIVEKLLNDTAYQVQIRHRSNQVLNPLWSDWSPVVIVPAELEQNPQVTMTETLVNRTRKVSLTWKPMPHAAAVTEVTYSLRDTQSSLGCPCQSRTRHITSHRHTTYVSYSAVNISIIAINAAGPSPPAIIPVPAQPAADLEICTTTLLDGKLNKMTCLELYELQDEDLRPKNVITLTARKKKAEREQIRKTVKDYVRYLYFEHRCDGRKPQTVKMCLFYQKEGAQKSSRYLLTTVLSGPCVSKQCHIIPSFTLDREESYLPWLLESFGTWKHLSFLVPRSAPQDFTSFSETHNSVHLSWKAIPPADQQGFLTHYSLCSVKISSQDESKECQNISASLRKHLLKNLTPGMKYNISLAGVTRVGEGPKATMPIHTPPEMHVNVLWSFSLLLLFFFITSSCTCILKRIKNKIFPPVPTPVIPDFTCYESQEMLERKEEVHELTLHQPHPEGKHVPKDAKETTILRGERDDGTDEDVENERGDSSISGGTSDESLSPGSTEQALRSSREGEVTDLEVDNEIAMLIYRNGLVFDVKTDSP